MLRRRRAYRLTCQQGYSAAPLVRLVAVARRHVGADIKPPWWPASAPPTLAQSLTTEYCRDMDKHTRYRARMTSRGYRQVAVWVPARDAELVQRFAARLARRYEGEQDRDEKQRRDRLDPDRDA